MEFALAETAITNPVEIIHSGNIDLLVNHRQTTISESDLKQLINSLITNESAKQNPIFDWENISPADSESFYDNPHKPSFFAKIKWFSQDMGFQRRILNEYKGQLSENKKQVYANASIQHEISLSPQIKTIISSPEIKKSLTDIGIDSLIFNEPLIGIINNKTGQKTIIYQYSSGENISRLLDESTQEQIVLILENAFKKNGIEPEDLSAKQLILDKNTKTLYLTDIEAYYKMN